MIDRKENGTQSLCQENKNKYVSGIKDAQTQKPEVPKGESRKDLPHSSCDRVKEYNSANRDSPRVNRNGLNPRFKKNSDSTCRRCFKINFSDFRLIALRTVFLQIGIVHSILRNCIIRIRIGDRSNSKPSKPQETKDDNGNYQRSHSVPQAPALPTNAMNSYQQAPYVQQGVYTGLPYYANEAEAFANSYYPQSPGIFPVSYLPHPDVADNNNMQQPFAPHLYPGVDFAQNYSGLFSPFVFPPPAPYNVPPQNLQEHWYTVAGQHYMQYPPVLPIEATCNGIAQNTNQNVSL